MLGLLLPVTVSGTQKNTGAVNLNETALVNALVAGNTHALEILYSSYSASLLGIISKIIKQDEIAEDVLQETFLKIWKSIQTYDASKGRLFTWMARLAKNKAIDYLRSSEEMKSLKNDDLSELTVEINQLYQIQYNPEFIGIKQLMNTLTPEQETILDMVYFQGYTQVEVAVALNIPIGTIKTRIRVAIKTLRTLF